MRFGYLISEIEVRARRLLDGQAPDIIAALGVMQRDLTEAKEIAAEVSREALDKTVSDL